MVISIFITAPSLAVIYTVTNTNNSGGGSFRQAISDANGGGAGTHTIRFNIPTADPNYNAGRGVFTITITSDLTKLTRANVTIDGSTQTAFTGDTNSGMLGTGGTVGRLGTVLNQINAPEIEIVSGGGRDYGIWADADNITIRGLAVYGFGTDYLNNEHAQILIGSYGSSKGTATIEQCVLGTKADAFADPTPTINDGRGACFLNFDNITFQNNLVGYVDASGIVTGDACTNIVVDQNEFRNCGLNSNWYDGVDISWSSVTATVTENLISNNGACGVECWGTSGGIDILRNTIEFSGQSPIANESSGIRLTGTGNLIENNIIKDGAAQGIIILGLSGSIPQTPTTQTKISKNNIYNNAGMAIDLLANGADEILGDGITPNSAPPNACGTSANHGNDGLDFPVIDAADHDPVTGNATITGQACPNSTIELYVAQAGAGDNDGTDDYGEGVTYVVTTTTDGSGNFSYTGPGFSGGQDITALVIDASDNTSEFSKNVFLEGYELCGNGIDDNGDGNVDEPLPGGVSENMLLWLKADAGFSTTTWTDQGPFGNDATVFGDPISVINSLNYNPGINFDGNDHVEVDLPELVFEDGNKHVSIFLVYTPSTAATNIGMFGNETALAGANIGLRDGQIQTGWWTNPAVNVPTYFGSTPHLITVQLDEEDNVGGAANSSAAYLNGSLIQNFLFDEQGAVDVDPDLHIGRTGTHANSKYFQGDIHEVIIYYESNGGPSISNDQRIEIGSYLATKYGITMSHDYSDSQ